MKNIFCQCEKLRRLNQRNCTECHNAEMRVWRKTHPPSIEEKKKSNCRRYANVYQQRGKLKQEPCLKCGDIKSQKHHPDYNKPLTVIWLCRSCHIQVHQELVSECQV